MLLLPSLKKKVMVPEQVVLLQEEALAELVSTVQEETFCARQE